MPKEKKETLPKEKTYIEKLGEIYDNIAKANYRIQLGNVAALLLALTCFLIGLFVATSHPVMTVFFCAAVISWGVSAYYYRQRRLSRAQMKNTLSEAEALSPSQPNLSNSISEEMRWQFNARVILMTFMLIALASIAYGGGTGLLAGAIIYIVVGVILYASSPSEPPFTKIHNAFKTDETTMLQKHSDGLSLNRGNGPDNNNTDPTDSSEQSHVFGDDEQDERQRLLPTTVVTPN